ncbi:MAG: (Fe-S)-binding protein [Gammaproteobacteria bacterium]|nr:(Fe-S)-binding protein [Gammaproteobacteria bacterium]MCP5136293.1 (Fe-S)-binding protein [Gammaproteobacteria bacterium]
MADPQAPLVALFGTCLVDLFRPSVGLSAIRLLQQAGCRVAFPESQTCCGQPMFNGGDLKHARELAIRHIELLAGYDYVVIPSGSCGGMIRVHYPQLFDDDDPWQARARDLARRSFELVSFLVDVMKLERVEATFPARAGYHDSCSGLRELGIQSQARKLLGTVQGLELLEMEHAETCCGFGGAFSVKFPAISTRLAADKLDSARATDAAILIGGDLGCLMHLAGYASRQGDPIRVYHVAEVLTGNTDLPPINGQAKAEP